MPRKISDDDYKMLDLYVRTVLRRSGVSEHSMTDAVEELMHPLTALIDGGQDSQEFIPYMKMMLAKWKGKNA